jgi:TfoX/Sxy family transcriptional regulator of competence genes
MTVAPDLVSRLRTALAQVPAVTEKRMFGSVGFVVRGHLCLSARDTRIMCRIGPQLHNEVIAQPGCSTVIMRGRECCGYVYVSVESLRTQKSLQRWIDAALMFNARLAPKAKATARLRASARTKAR